MSAKKISDHQWREILAFLRKHPRVYVGNQANCRRFVEGVHWILRTGAQWRELPERYGKWNAVYKRFARWEEHGVWQVLFEHVADDPDLESVMPDGSVIRAHMSAAGGSKKTAVKLSKP